MNKNQEKIFNEEFPDMFKNLYGDMDKTCLAFGLECGEGWKELIYNLCKDIQEELVKQGEEDNFQVEQVKEKFGTLRFYYNGFDNDTIRDLVRKAEEESSVTCEGCGKESKLSTNGWYSTVCKDCRGNE